MTRIKLWLGVGAFVLTQSGQVAITRSGPEFSIGGTPALAGERGEGDERGERGEGEEGESGERGERGEGEEGEEGRSSR